MYYYAHVLIPDIFSCPVLKKEDLTIKWADSEVNKLSDVPMNSIDFLIMVSPAHTKPVSHMSHKAF